MGPIAQYPPKIATEQFVSWVGGVLRKSPPRCSQQMSLGQCKFSYAHVGRGLNTGKMVFICRLCRRKAQRKDIGGCSFSPCPENILLSFSLHLLSCCLSIKAHCECLHTSLWLGPVRGHQDLQLPSLMARLLTNFHS